MKNKIEKLNNVARFITEFLIVISFSLSFVCIFSGKYVAGALLGLFFIWFCFRYLSDQLAIIREKFIFITNVFDILLKSSGIDPDANKNEVK